MCFFVIVVVYNNKILNSTTINGLIDFCQSKKSMVIILDNSTNEMIKNANSSYSNESVIYVDNGGNIGLSKAYNKGIDIARKNSKGDYFVMISDDDTSFSDEYLENGYTEMMHGKHLVSGIVYVGETVFSPQTHKIGAVSKMVPVSKAGEYDNIYCINSGLFFDNTIIDKVQFDENLFLDMVDYRFMDCLSRENMNHVCIVEGRIDQDFSGSRKIYNSGQAERYRIFKKDFSKYCELENKGFLYKYGILFKRFLNVQVLSRINTFFDK